MVLGGGVGGESKNTPMSGVILTGIPEIDDKLINFKSCSIKIALQKLKIFRSSE